MAPAYPVGLVSSFSRGPRAWARPVGAGRASFLDGLPVHVRSLRRVAHRFQIYQFSSSAVRVRAIVPAVRNVTLRGADAGAR